VEARNAAVRRIAAERGLPVVDFYTVAYEQRDHLTDGIHLDGEGYKALAAELLRAAEELCP
jgi:lysophospholipase L1-like esterase